MYGANTAAHKLEYWPRIDSSEEDWASQWTLYTCCSCMAGLLHTTRLGPRWTESLPQTSHLLGWWPGSLWGKRILRRLIIWLSQSGSDSPALESPQGCGSESSALSHWMVPNVGWPGAGQSGGVACVELGKEKQIFNFLPSWNCWLFSWALCRLASPEGQREITSSLQIRQTVTRKQFWCEQASILGSQFFSMSCIFLSFR